LSLVLSVVQGLIKTTLLNEIILSIENNFLTPLEKQIDKYMKT